MSDNDDALVGRLLTRREVLGLFSIAGAALIVGCADDSKSPSPISATVTPTTLSTRAAAAAATVSDPSTTTTPACVVVPELTEGPYFVDEKLNRSDIRSDPSDNSMVKGDQLDIALNVSRVGGDASCSALSGAQVDVWHCDAVGVYSDVSGMGVNSTGKKFLRGYQLTDNDGKAVFTTIYPGWYQGRATHIHFKIRMADGYEFTSQWFFDDARSDTVHAQGAYAAKGASRRPPNARDNIFRGTNGLLTLAVAPSGNGYQASFDIGLRST